MVRRPSPPSSSSSMGGTAGKAGKAGVRIVLADFGLEYYFPRVESVGAVSVMAVVV